MNHDTRENREHGNSSRVLSLVEGIKLEDFFLVIDRTRVQGGNRGCRKNLESRISFSIIQPVILLRDRCDFRRKFLRSAIAESATKDLVRKMAYKRDRASSGTLRPETGENEGESRLTESRANLHCSGRKCVTSFVRFPKWLPMWVENTPGRVTRTRPPVNRRDSWRDERVKCWRHGVMAPNEK